jgi:hypothetical protein
VAPLELFLFRLRGWEERLQQLIDKMADWIWRKTTVLNYDHLLGELQVL